MTATDPFASLTEHYDANKLLWACGKRTNLNENPPLQVTQDSHGTIRIQKISPRFQEYTGIQVGYQFLQLQGKNVPDYEGGFDEIHRTIEESLAMEVVVLKCDVDSAVPKKRKSKRKSDMNDPVKSSSIRKKDKRTREIQIKYKKKDLLWVTNTRSSASQSTPFQLIQVDDNVITVHQVDPQFQEATGMKKGQRLVMLQEKDIESYQDFNDIQAVIQETLMINLVLVVSKKKKKKKKKLSTERQ